MDVEVVEGVDVEVVEVKGVGDCISDLYGLYFFSPQYYYARLQVHKSWIVFF